MTDAPTMSVDAMPQRPPFRFVDTIVEVSADRIVTTVRADPDADFFRGHYPGNPVMPGVLISEAVFQSGALLVAHREGVHDPRHGTPVLTRIRDARFRRMVRPGDVLRVEVVLDDALDGAYYMTGRVTVDSHAVLRVSFACKLAPVDGAHAGGVRPAPGRDGARP